MSPKAMVDRSRVEALVYPPPNHIYSFSSLPFLQWFCLSFFSLPYYVDFPFRIFTLLSLDPLLFFLFTFCLPFPRPPILTLISLQPSCSYFFFPLLHFPSFIILCSPLSPIILQPGSRTLASHFLLIIIVCYKKAPFVIFPLPFSFSAHFAIRHVSDPREKHWGEGG